jgi:hypothetical protein
MNIFSVMKIICTGSVDNIKHYFNLFRKSAEFCLNTHALNQTRVHTILAHFKFKSLKETSTYSLMTLYADYFFAVAA